MDNMLRRVIGEDLELRTIPAATLGRTKADPGQLEQVIMNLIVNARDAMPDGGTLTIETANVELDATHAHLHPGITPGPFVMLAVTDTGVGIDKATQARIFEPFFTTKEHGKGTGLGLSTVFGIVQQSGGHIVVESQPNQGTTFKVYFARTSAAADVHPDDPPRPVSQRGSETILLVEDEEQVRRLVGKILTEQGYRVLEAASPSEALEISRRTGEAIQLLITDIVMPQMNGRVLSERLRTERPDMEVLFMSGYADKVIGHEGVLDPDIAFLQKPITPTTLTSLVRRMLNERGRRPTRRA
ncbi:MAG TPA: ATP-binding protein [Polyangia bacterium]|jgi:CheY-like chemotaxis protein